MRNILDGKPTEEQRQR